MPLDRQAQVGEPQGLPGLQEPLEWEQQAGQDQPAQRAGQAQVQRDLQGPLAQAAEPLVLQALQAMTVQPDRQARELQVQLARPVPLEWVVALPVRQGRPAQALPGLQGRPEREQPDLQV